MTKNVMNIILISLLGLFALSSCQKKQDAAIADIDQTEYPDQEGWKSTVTSSKSGIVGAIIEYGHMRRFKKRNVVEFDSGIVVDFYNEQGVHTSNLTSNRGRLDEATNNIEAFGNVIVVSDTGITLKTERLKWDNSIEKIISNNFVTIVTAEKDTFYGNGFESDQNLENWHITGFSGKASKGLDLDFQFKKKKQESDSASKIIVVDTLKDTAAVIK
jgi:LPS export ABC transporter protein LptC